MQSPYLSPPSIPTPTSDPTASTCIPPAEAYDTETTATLAAVIYFLTFTCVPCSGRSSHNVSKQGYHHGSVLITCPSCRNRHVISDHLHIFGDRKMTVEDLMRERGQLVKRGTLGEDGDVEFWEDETATDGTDNATSDAVNELDYLGEEETACRLREMRDPSAQSTNATARPSPPLGAGSARPTVDGTSHPQSLPSTRRQYSSRRPAFRTAMSSVNFEREMNALRDALRDDVEEEKMHPVRAQSLSSSLPIGRLPAAENLRKREVISSPNGFTITKVDAGNPSRRVLKKMRENATTYHDWTGAIRQKARPNPNELWAQSKAEGKRSVLDRLPREEAIVHAQRFIRKSDEGNSSAINVFSKVVPKKVETLEAKFAHLERPLPRSYWPGPGRHDASSGFELPRGSRMLAEMIERAATPRPAQSTAPKEAGSEPTSMSGDPGTVSANAARAAGEEPQESDPPIGGSSGRYSVLRRVSIPREKRPHLPPRNSVPPWERRAVFGPKGSGASSKSKSKHGRDDMDIWGDEAMSADLRRMIEWGTAKGSSERDDRPPSI
ncbi:hypothetical protein DL764_004757 [Monosporascus ibericus]|uniref:DNL-type domain-containing protein n=1 Tax=Monosporascus ibericus TaxID=155417 RepID=A0A4Q4TBH2_9PEZI|nr:hypothetical protein DL764_004757 [Monosporascus ibericus]